MKLAEMIQCMDEADKTRGYRAQISRFDGERFEDVLGLLDRFDRRLVLDGFTGEPATDCIDRSMSIRQDGPPGGFESDFRSTFGKGDRDG